MLLEFEACSWSDIVMEVFSPLKVFSSPPCLDIAAWVQALGRGLELSRGATLNPKVAGVSVPLLLPLPQLEPRVWSSEMRLTPKVDRKIKLMKRCNQWSNAWLAARKLDCSKKLESLPNTKFLLTQQSNVDNPHAQVSSKFHCRRY